MNSETVDLHFTYIEADIVSALKLSYKRTYRITNKAAISSVAIVFGFIGLIFQPDTLLWYMLFLIGIVMLALYSLAYFYGTRKRLKGHPTLSDRCHITFSDEHIIFRTEDVQSQFKWSYYEEVWESSTLYFLIRADKSFTVIPKRVFDEGEQERIFRAMLNRHLGKLIKLHAGSIKGAEIKTDYVPKSLEPPDWR